MPVALDELGHVMGKKKCFIVTDSFLYQNGYVKPIEEKLDEMGIQHTCFYDVAPDPSLSCAQEGARAMTSFAPDCIIALGGGSAMDAAKIMWVMYEHPEVDFLDMAMRFMDIRKRIYTFPKMGEKAYFVAIPTSSGTGSEVTPFAVITDERTGTKYPLADYELLPNMAIIDARQHDDPAKGTDQCLRYRRSDPCTGSVCFDHGNRLYRWSGTQGDEEYTSVSCQARMKTAPTTRLPAKRWRMLPAWQVWHLQTLSSGSATRWHTSWALTTTCRTA